MAAESFKRIFVSALLLVSTVSVASAGDLSQLDFLLGVWEGVGGGHPGEGTGSTTFEYSLQDHVILRKNHSEYPAAQSRPASEHDDLMVIYKDSEGQLKADYYDSEGHVIRYSGVLANDQLILTSPAAGKSPGFRLTYTRNKDGSLGGLFEIASPDKPEAYSQYLSWTSRRHAGRPK